LTEKKSIRLFTIFFLKRKKLFYDILYKGYNRIFICILHNRTDPVKRLGKN
jgi:hypothetical protein